MASTKTCQCVRMNTSVLGWHGTSASWPDSEVAECAYDLRFLGYSGLVVLIASLSESDPERKPLPSGMRWGSCGI
jgi:hypothetical protein